MVLVVVEVVRRGGVVVVEVVERGGVVVVVVEVIEVD